MADNVEITAGSGTTIATDEVGGVQHPLSKLEFGGDGQAVMVDATHPLPVSDAALLAALLAQGPLTDAQLRAAALAVTAAALPLPTGASTEATLEAVRALLAGTLTTGLPAGAATDAKLETIRLLLASASTAALQGTGNASLASILAALQGVLAISAAALPLPTGAATDTTLAAVRDRLPATAHTQPLTDAQLRSAAVPVSCADLAGLLGALHSEDAPHASGDTGQLMLAVRWDTDESTADVGDYTVLKLDEKGRLKVASQPSSYPDGTGNITAIQASISTPVAGGTVAVDVSMASNVMAWCSGTFAGVNCAFEGSLESSGDANWFGVNAVRSNANTIETSTGALSAAPAYAWELSVNGLKRLRVRATARTSGTQSWRFTLGSYATEPIPANPVSNVSANVGTVAPSLWSDTTTVLAAAAVYTGTSRDAGSTPAYQRFAARAYADQAGTLAVQDSTDGSTWRTVESVALAAGETKTLNVQCLARYHRVLYTNGATLQGAFRLTSGLHRI